MILPISSQPHGYSSHIPPQVSLPPELQAYIGDVQTSLGHLQADAKSARSDLLIEHLKELDQHMDLFFNTLNKSSNRGLEKLFKDQFEAAHNRFHEALSDIIGPSGASLRDKLHESDKLIARFLDVLPQEGWQQLSEKAAFFSQELSAIFAPS